ncbi:MAG TPA: response regulator [Cyclobacteriaceae bacterium]|nr:response regulator [Cyclobacteriaceae bacterium]
MATSASIVVVDDDSDDRTILKDYFIEVGLQEDAVRFFENGKQCIEYLNGLDGKSLPAIIVLDMNMPIMNGSQTLIYLKQDPKLRKIPVFVYSTSDNEQEKRKGLSLGATEYLVKPMNYEEGLALVKKVIAALT